MIANDREREIDREREVEREREREVERGIQTVELVSAQRNRTTVLSEFNQRNKCLILNSMVRYLSREIDRETEGEIQILFR